jgi:hypothetical protein
MLSVVVAAELPEHHITPPAKMGTNAVAYFDLETTGVDSDAHVTVAVVKMVDDNAESTHRVFHDGYGSVMSAATAVDVVKLMALARTVYSYNGAAFDFKMIAATAPDDAEHQALTAEVCRRHCDVMLDFSATFGYYSAMSAWTAPGKGKTATGAWAATAWFTDEAHAVADYCAADTDVLESIVTRGLRQGALARTAAATGRVSVWTLTNALKAPRFRTATESVAAFIKTPPNTRWMSNPPDIGSAMSWI